MLDNHVAYKYETPYKGPFMITQCGTNGTVTVQYNAIKIGYNILCIKPYKSNTNAEDIITGNMYEDFIILLAVIHFYVIL